jgi:20S proteasome subunit beta 6
VSLNFLAVAGKDFIVIGGDTRMSSGYTILARNISKITKLTDTTYIASSGMRADIDAFHRLLHLKIKSYVYSFHREPDTETIA